MSETKKKLSEKQLRIVQVAAGILSTLILILSMFLASIMAGGYISYLYLIIFLVIMFGRSWVERRFRLRLGLYNLVLIDGILAAISLYLIYLFFMQTTQPVSVEMWAKILITVGAFLVLAVLGIYIPAKRHFKRKAEGTLPTVRIPEEPERPDSHDEAAGGPVHSGPLTTSQKIAAMMKDLEESDNKKGENDK